LSRAASRLDAPDIANDGRKEYGSVQADPVPSVGPGPPLNRLSQSRTAHPAKPPIREKFNAEESSAARAQLIQEIENVPGDGLQPRAIAISKAKNRLLAPDARQVEEAFSARIARQDGSPEAAATEGEPTSTASSPGEPPLVSARSRPS